MTHNEVSTMEVHIPYQAEEGVMPPVEGVYDPEVRDAHIYELTGISVKNVSERPSLKETRRLVRGVQQGNTEDMEALIALRLRWVYDSFAVRPEILARYDLELQDVLQIGAMAVIEAAQETDANAENITSTMTSRARNVMVDYIAATRLTGPASRNEKVTEPVDLTSSQELENILNRNKALLANSSDNSDVEAEVVADNSPGLWDIIRDKGHPKRSVSILEYRYRDILSPNPRTLENTAQAFNVTRERIRQIEISLLEKLARMAAEGLLDDSKIDRDNGVPYLAVRPFDIQRWQKEQTHYSKLNVNDVDEDVTPSGENEGILGSTTVEKANTHDTRYRKPSVFRRTAKAILDEIRDISQG